MRRRCRLAGKLPAALIDRTGNSVALILKTAAELAGRDEERRSA